MMNFDLKPYPLVSHLSSLTSHLSLLLSLLGHYIHRVIFPLTR